MLINTHPHQDKCKLTWITASLVCHKSPCNKNADFPEVIFFCDFHLKILRISFHAPGNNTSCKMLKMVWEICVLVREKVREVRGVGGNPEERRKVL